MLSLWNLFEASLLCLNAICVLHEERFMVKMGWGVDTQMQAYGEPSVKSQMLNLVRSIRTVARGDKRFLLDINNTKDVGTKYDDGLLPVSMSKLVKALKRKKSYRLKLQYLGDPIEISNLSWIVKCRCFKCPKAVRTESIFHFVSADFLQRTHNFV